MTADLRLWLDRDGDMWGEEPDGSVSPLTGPIAWALPGSSARREFVEAEFGPLAEVQP